MVKLITLLIPILVLTFYLLSASPNMEALLWVSLALIILLGISFLFKPIHYILDSGNIVIKKILFSKSIEINDVKSIESIEYKDLKVLIRLYGSGGMWGWFGYFYTSNYGVVNMQCTEKENLVLITTKQDKKIVLCPIEKDYFIKELNLKIKEFSKFSY